MSGTSIVLGVLFLGIICFIAMIVFRSEEIPNHEWEEMIKLPEEK